MINRNWLQVKRAIFKSAREVYVLADSSKFGVARGANIQRAATKSTNMAYEVHWLRL